MVTDLTHTFTAVQAGVAPTDEGVAAEILRGSWSQAGGKLVSSTDRDQRPLVAFNMETGQQHARIAVSPDGGDRLCWRVQDVDNCYEARVVKTVTTQTSDPVTQYEWAQKYNAGHIIYLGEVGSHAFHSDPTRTAWGTATTPPSFPDRYEHTSSTGTVHAHSKTGTPFKTGKTREVGGGETTVTSQRVVVARIDAGVVTTLTFINGATSFLEVLAVGSKVTVYTSAGSRTLDAAAVQRYISATKVGLGRAPSEQSGSALDDLVAVASVTAPNAPLLISPVGGQIVDVQRSLILRHAFSDDDAGDVQIARQVRTKLPADGDYKLWDGSALVDPQAGEIAAADPNSVTGATILSGTHDTDDLTGAVPNAGTRLWSKRTRDTAQLWGPWQTDASFLSQAAPVGSFVSPGPDDPAQTINPTFFLSYAQSDGVAKVGHEIRLYEGTATVDPDVDVPLIDTGVVADAGLEEIVSGVEPGVTYTAYGRVYASGDQPSEWFVTTFLVDLPIPATPVDAYADDPANARQVLEALIVGNMLPVEVANLEGEAVPEGVTATNATLSLTTEQHKAGGQSLKVIADASGDVVVKLPAQLLAAGAPMSGVVAARDGGTIRPVRLRMRERTDQAEELALHVGDAVVAEPEAPPPPPPAETFTLQFSKSASLEDPALLDGADIAGEVAIFLAGDTFAGVTQVRWLLDAVEHRIDSTQPYTYFSAVLGTLPAGVRTITAEVTRDAASGGNVTHNAVVTVEPPIEPEPTEPMAWTPLVVPDWAALTPTVVVAAANASSAQKSAADYVMDGTGDEVQVNAALAEGGIIEIVPDFPTMSIAGAIVVPHDDTILFCRGKATVTFPDALDIPLQGYGTKTIAASDSTIQSMSIGDSTIRLNGDFRSQVAAGDVVAYGDETVWNPMRNNQTGGEMVQVAGVAFANNVTTLTIEPPEGRPGEDPIRFPCITNRRFYTFNFKERVGIRGFNFVRSSGSGSNRNEIIVFTAAKDCWVQDVECNGRKVSRTGIMFEDAWRCIAQDVDVRNIADNTATSGTTGYGVKLTSSRYCTVRRVNGYGCRHTFDVNGGARREPMATDWAVIDANSERSWAAACATHGGSRFGHIIRPRGNLGIGNGGMLGTRGDDTTILDIGPFRLENRSQDFSRTQGQNALRFGEGSIVSGVSDALGQGATNLTVTFADGQSYNLSQLLDRYVLRFLDQARTVSIDFKGAKFSGISGAAIRFDDCAQITAVVIENVDIDMGGSSAPLISVDNADVNSSTIDITITGTVRNHNGPILSTSKTNVGSTSGLVSV